MKIKLASAVLAVSVLFSSWLYWGSDLKVEQLLTANEWQSTMVTVITDSLPDDTVGPLRRVNVESNVKYLPNGDYIRVANIKLFAQGSTAESTINISEKGRWEVSDNYLLVSPSEFKDISSSQSKDFSEAQLRLITQIFKLDAEQSRRIDVVNEKTLLLTSLNHGSSVLFKTNFDWMIRGRRPLCFAYGLARYHYSLFRFTNRQHAGFTFRWRSRLASIPFTHLSRLTVLRCARHT